MLLTTGVITKEELLAWRDDDDDESPGRGRALGMLEDMFEELAA